MLAESSTGHIGCCANNFFLEHGHPRGSLHGGPSCVGGWGGSVTPKPKIPQPGTLWPECDSNLSAFLSCEVHRMFVEERGKRQPHLLNFSSLGVMSPSDDGDHPCGCWMRLVIREIVACSQFYICLRFPNPLWTACFIVTSSKRIKKTQHNIWVWYDIKPSMPNLGQTRSWLWACWMQFCWEADLGGFKGACVAGVSSWWRGLRTCCHCSVCCLPGITRAWSPFFLSSLYQLRISEQQDHLQRGWLGLCSWPPCSLGTLLHARSMSFCKLQRATADWFQQLCPCVSKSLVCQQLPLLHKCDASVSYALSERLRFLMTTISLKLCMVFVSSGCIPFCVREKNVFMPGYICV